jgi:hypothetical protein
MNVVRIQLKGQYLDEITGYCFDTNIVGFMRAHLYEHEFPYFLKAYQSPDHYFRGETPELPDKVCASVQIEPLDIYGYNYTIEKDYGLSRINHDIRARDIAAVTVARNWRIRRRFPRITKYAIAKRMPMAPEND